LATSTDLAALEAGDLAGVVVDADHIGAELRKTGAGNQTDIAGANHRNAHSAYSKELWLAAARPADQ
jgi:hypothetical protein